ncbi:hypothetical protein ACN20G_18370 [Streptomyces sp. BI20]|uniref:hypothetical protein n=1 Tax=Streptomyces sp. BI20 TaxID=3403460 RepID=UPI003C7735A1
MRRRTAHLVTACALASAAFAVPVAGAMAAPGDFARLEVWPSTATAGTTVTVNTSACGKKGGGADGDATAVGGGRFRLTAGTHKEVLVGQFRVGHEARPGTHAIGVTCADGKYATGDLVVTSHGPQGHVRTGVGGAAAMGAASPGPARVAAGAVTLTAAVVGGTWLLRRRASGVRQP